MQETMKCYNPELWGKLLELLPEKLVSICTIQEGQKSMSTDELYSIQMTLKLNTRVRFVTHRIKLKMRLT